MIEVKDYMNLGYHDIVFLEVETKERKSGYNEEYTRQTLVAYDKDRIPHRIVIVWTEHPLKPRTNVIESDEVIPHMEYDKIRAQKGGIADNKAYRDRVAKMEKDRAKAEHALDELIPACPKCERLMITRENSWDGSHFWGCPHFPDCKGTRNMSKATYKRYCKLKTQALRR